MSNDTEYMRAAIEVARAGLSRGEQPFGAVIAAGDRIVSRAFSRKVATGDPTAHAETLAIRSAAQQLKSRMLEHCTLYTTCEPCPMCLGAMLNVGIRRLVIGARLSDLASNTVFHFGSYSAESFAAMMGWELAITAGILAADCTALYREAPVPLTR